MKIKLFLLPMILLCVAATEVSETPPAIWPMMVKRHSGQSSLMTVSSTG